MSSGGAILGKLLKPQFEKLTEAKPKFVKTKAKKGHLIIVQ